MLRMAKFSYAFYSFFFPLNLHNPNLVLLKWNNIRTVIKNKKIKKIKEQPKAFFLIFVFSSPKICLEFTKGWLKGS